jgi:hypothetical protein
MEDDEHHRRGSARALARSVYLVASVLRIVCHC